MNKKTLLSVALGAVLATALFASLIIFQVLVPAQPAQIPKQIQAPATLEKFKASGGSGVYEGFFLVNDAAKDQGIWSKNGLDPEFVFILGRPGPTPSDIKEQVASGIKIGFAATSASLLARADGVAVKIVTGYIGQGQVKLFVKADGPIKTVNELNGKKVGVSSIDSFHYRALTYLSNKIAIRPEAVALGNLTNNVVALKLGRIDAFISAEGSVLRLVDSGELKILMNITDIYPKVMAGNVLWATDDLIEKDPDLVRRFVKAWLEAVKHLKENPNYASDLYTKRSYAPRDLADKVISQIDWQPSGRGSGQDLVVAVSNFWQWSKDSGAIPADVNVKIEDAVDIRFLP